MSLDKLLANGLARYEKAERAKGLSLIPHERRAYEKGFLDGYRKGLNAAYRSVDRALDQSGVRPARSLVASNHARKRRPGRVPAGRSSTGS